MNAPAQLSMFEPDATEATRLCGGYLADADRFAKLADKYELLRMPGAVAQCERDTLAALQAATVLAIYLDLLEASA